MFRQAILGLTLVSRLVAGPPLGLEEVNKKIQSMDPIFTEMIETQHTRIVREEAGLQYNAHQEGLASYIAASLEDKIILVQDAEDRINLASIDAIPHEFFHQFYHAIKNKSIEGLKGPSIEELDKHLLKRMMSKDYEHIHLHAKISLWSQLIDSELNSYINAINDIQLATTIMEFPEKNSLEIEGLDRIKTILNEGRTAASKFIPLYQSDADYEYTALNEGQSLSTSQERLEEIERQGEQIWHTLYSEQKILNKAREQDYKFAVGEKVAQIDGVSQEILQQFNDLPEIDQGILWDETDNRLQHQASTRTKLEDPSEILARMSSAIHDLHTGKATPNQYTPNQEDLKFLSKYRKNGRPVLKNAIGKYNLMLQMSADGVDPAIARETILGSEHITYKGQVYEFKRTNIELQDIPLQRNKN